MIGFRARTPACTGTFQLHSGQHFLSQALNGESIGLEEVHNGIWNIIYYETLLGRLDEHTHNTPSPGLPPSAESVNHVPGHLVSYVPGCSPGEVISPFSCICVAGCARRGTVAYSTDSE